MAVQCRNVTRRRSSSVKMAAPLATGNLMFSCDSPSYIGKGLKGSGLGVVAALARIETD